MQQVVCFRQVTTQSGRNRVIRLMPVDPASKHQTMSPEPAWHNTHDPNRVILLVQRRILEVLDARRDGELLCHGNAVEGLNRVLVIETRAKRRFVWLTPVKSDA